MSGAVSITATIQMPSGMKRMIKRVLVRLPGGGRSAGYDLNWRHL